jgi:precorrin-2/cobalt-factor-2 C20-methyltransferase
VAYPAPEEGDSFARRIVAEWLDRGQREIRVRFPMRPGPPPAAIYDGAAAQLAAVMDAGEDVAYLCQGDPLFYGSFAGILTRLAARYKVTVVPGVSSLTACAAAASVPLVQRDETLAVIPARLAEDELARRLTQVDAAAIIKLGRHFAKLRRVLSRLGLIDGAVYVERASLPSQRVAPLATIDPASVPYFAMALVRRGGQAA